MKAIFLLISLVVLISCSHPTPEKAKMSVKQTAEVMMELRLANAAYNIYHNQMAEENKDWKPYQAEIFQRLKIQPDDFSSSLKIHSQNPDSILLMDSLVMEKLETKSRKEIQPGIDTHHPIKKYKGQINRKGS
jgi:hypothetical protein